MKTFKCLKMNSTEHKTKKNYKETIVLGRQAIITGCGVRRGLNRFYGASSFTLMFRCGLHNLVCCSARLEVSSLINGSSRAPIRIDKKTVMKQG